MRRDSVDHGRRWKLMFKGPNDRRWIVLGSVGSAAQATAWQFRFFGSGDYRIQSPAKQEVTTHAGN